MPKICDEMCYGEPCEYDVCPFQHEYTQNNEIVSGYRYVGDPEKDRMLEWAKQFKENHRCETCPFVKNEADVGVGIIYDCDAVCRMEIGDILREMEGYMVNL